jgi:hypothetical protein
MSASDVIALLDIVRQQRDVAPPAAQRAVKRALVAVQSMPPGETQQRLAKRLVDAVVMNCTVLEHVPLHERASGLPNALPIALSATALLVDPCDRALALRNIALTQYRARRAYFVTLLSALKLAQAVTNTDRDWAVSLVCDALSWTENETVAINAANTIETIAWRDVIYSAAAHAAAKRGALSIARDAVSRIESEDWKIVAARLVATFSR